MNSFIEVFSHINKTIYKPMGIVAHQLQEEKQNASYGAGLFSISMTIIRFRVAKKTSKKQGQFVAIWEKDKWGNNKPYLYKDAPHFLIITVLNTANQVGQFIFPKNVLLNKGILESENTRGKMGIRVYPTWEKALNPTAKRTQDWQSAYFVTLDSKHEKRVKDLLRIQRFT